MFPLVCIPGFHRLRYPDHHLHILELGHEAVPGTRSPGLPPAWSAMLPQSAETNTFNAISAMAQEKKHIAFGRSKELFSSPGLNATAHGGVRSTPTTAL